MAAGTVSWSLFDDHCFCEADGVCMRQVFADETCHEVPIGHQECITPPSPRLQEEYHQSSIITISSNSGSSTLVNESPRPTHPSSGLMISHSIAMKEATTALEKLNAVEVQMEEHHLGVLDTAVEIDGAGFVPSLAVGDYAYYEIALKAAVAGHGRLRGAYWRVVQTDERSDIVRNDLRKILMVARPIGEQNWKLCQARKDMKGAICGDQEPSDMKPQHSPEDRKRDAGLPSADDEPPKEEITATICNYIHPEPDSQLESLQKDAMVSDKAWINEPASSVVREWPLGKVVMKFWRLLRYLCGLPKSMKLVDPEQGYGKA